MNQYGCQIMGLQSFGNKIGPIEITSGNMYALLFWGREGKIANPAECVCL